MHRRPILRLWLETPAILALALVAMSLGWASPSFLQAQTQTSEETKTANERHVSFLEDCLAAATSTGDTPNRCLGTLAEPCMKRPENQSNAGVVGCYRNENAAWSALRARFSARLQDGLSTDEALAALEAAEDAWRHYRDESCALPFSVIDGDAASVWSATCANNKTAERAIDLYRMLPMVGF